MRKPFAIVALFIATSFLVLGSQFADAHEVDHAEPLKVPFATGEYRPYSSESMPGFGATAELISAICRAANIQPEFKFFPWKRAELRLANGTAFGAFPYSANPERQLHFDFSDDLYRVTNAFVYYDGNPKMRAISGDEGLDALKTFKFGIILGSFAESRLKEHKINYVAVNSVDQLVRMLRYNRIDIYVDDEAAIFDAVNRLFPADVTHFRALTTPFDERKPNNVMVSKTYPNSVEILKQFNSGLAKIKKTDEYDKILAKYHLRK